LVKRILKMSSIAILTPVCSRNQNYNNFNEVPFVNFLYPSLLKTIDEKHEYKIFIGIDSTDEFYSNNIAEFYFLGAPSNVVLNQLFYTTANTSLHLHGTSYFKKHMIVDTIIFFRLGMMLKSLVTGRTNLLTV